MFTKKIANDIMIQLECEANKKFIILYSVTQNVIGSYIHMI